MKNDWRYRNQGRFLNNINFSFKKYDVPYPAHDHCKELLLGEWQCSVLQTYEDWTIQPEKTTNTIEGENK